MPEDRKHNDAVEVTDEQLEDVAGGAGGGIFNRESTVTVTSATVSGNLANDPDSLQIADQEDDRNV